MDGVGEKMAVCVLINKKINAFGLGTEKLGRCEWIQHESWGSSISDIALSVVTNIIKGLLSIHQQEGLHVSGDDDESVVCMIEFSCQFLCSRMPCSGVLNIFS